MATRSESGRRIGSVGVVGGGFSGTLVALNLLRSARSGVHVEVFERSGRFGPGVAYGTTNPEHLLNVPAKLMSAWPDAPEHFADWLAARVPGSDPGCFAPRRLYGEYLAEMLQTAASAAPGRLRFREDEVVDLRETPGGVQLQTSRGREHRVDALILATGNPRPLDPVAASNVLRESGVYVGDPWGTDPLAGLAAEDPILLIGTGLTAVDILVDAQARGLRGSIAAVSRRGLTPLSHAPALGTALPPFTDGDRPATALALLRGLRAAVANHPHGPADWRAVVDSIRPRISELWQGLDETQRGRFLEHLGPYWDVHRHRVSPTIAEVVHRAQAEGRLEVLAGRVVALAPDGEGAAVEVALRGGGTTRTIAVRRVINCTGPSRDVRRTRSALIRSLFERGVAIPGSTGMGLATTDDFRLIRSDGRASARVFAMGPLLKGMLWETTAVRELRRQATDVARLIGDQVQALDRRVPEPHWEFARRSPAAKQTVRRPTEH